MTRNKRIAIDIAVSSFTYLAIFIAGAGLWALLILPYGMWNFYDGITRHELYDNDNHN